MSRQSTIASRVAAWAITGLSLVAFGVLLIGDVTDTVQQEDPQPLLGLAALAFAVMGALILLRRPGHRFGWALAGIGLTVLVTGVLQALVDSQVVSGVEALFGLGEVAYWSSIFYLLPLAILWFPNGYPPTPRWRWVSWLATGALIPVVFLALFQAQFCVKRSMENVCIEFVDNPVGIAGLQGPEQSTIGSIFLAGLLVALVGAMVSMVVRFVRSRGVERLQLKWFTFAVGVFVGFILISGVLVQAILGIEAGTTGDVINDALFSLGLTAIPVAAGIAVLRYRLYEIDRVINRTVVYSVVVGSLATLYGIIVAGIPVLLPQTQNRDVLVAGATLAAFFLFSPLRKRVQGFVDRRFYRSRYDAQRVVEEFSDRLRDEMNLDQLTADWVGVVQETVRPSTVSVWVRER